MAGILDYSPYAGLLTPEQQQQIQSSLITNLGLGLLAQSGPSTTPRNLGSSFGQSGLSAIQQGNQTASGLLNSQALKMKLDEMRAEQERQGKLPGIIGQASKTYTPGQGQPPILDQPGTGLLGGMERGDPNALPSALGQIAGLGGPTGQMGLRGLTSLYASNQQRSPYFQAVPTQQGIKVLDVRTGKFAEPPGGPLMPPQYDPRTMANVESAKTGGSEAAKLVAATPQNTLKISDQVEKAQQALKKTLDYSKSAIGGGTGYFETLGGAKWYFSPELQGLAADYNIINLKNLVTTFQGFSRSIDTAVERAAWDATQPNIKNKTSTNINILVGNIALGAKAAAEAQARNDYIQSNPKKGLEGYVSPVIGNTSVLFDTQGNPKLVPKVQVDTLKSQGWLDADQYVKTLEPGKPQPQQGGWSIRPLGQ